MQLDAYIFDLSLVETAAKSLQTELQHSKSQEDAWNNSSLELLRASDVRLWRFLQFDLDTLEYYIIQMTCILVYLIHACTTMTSVWVYFKQSMWLELDMVKWINN